VLLAFGDWFVQRRLGLPHQLSAFPLLGRGNRGLNLPINAERRRRKAVTAMAFNPTDAGLRLLVPTTTARIWALAEKKRWSSPDSHQWATASAKTGGFGCSLHGTTSVVIFSRCGLLPYATIPCSAAAHCSFIFKRQRSGGV
jgi:hypothetical protein